MAVNYTPLTTANNLNPTDLNQRLQSLDDAIEDVKDGDASFTNLALAAATTLTISSGAVTLTRMYHVIAAETGTSDDLDTITAAGDRTFVMLQADSGDTITLKHGTGNITTWNGLDVAMSGDDHVLLFYDGSGWVTLHTGGVESLANLSDVSAAAQTANFVMAAGDGATGGDYRGRALVVADLPDEAFPVRATMWHDEAEVVTGNALASAKDTNQRYNTVSYQNPAANGDVFYNSFFIRAGTYDLHILGETNNNYGIIDWAIKAEGGSFSNIATGQDWYSAALTYNVKKTVSGFSVATSGHYVLRGTVNGKNGSSSAYSIVLTKLWIVPNGGY